MDCCLIQTLLFLLSFNIILGSAQHHHAHEHASIKNSINDSRPNKVGSLLSLSSQNPETNNSIDAGQEDTMPAATIESTNHTVPGVNHTHGHRNSSMAPKCHTHADNSSSKHVECVCAMFSIKAPIESDVPLMSKTFYNVSCHDHGSGEDVCTEVCISFATSQYKEADNIICSHIYNATDLTAFLHWKMCHENNWVFTGIQSPKLLCCNEGEPIECENVPHTVPT